MFSQGTFSFSEQRNNHLSNVNSNLANCRYYKSKYLQLNASVLLNLNKTFIKKIIYARCHVKTLTFYKKTILNRMW